MITFECYWGKSEVFSEARALIKSKLFFWASEYLERRRLVEFAISLFFLWTHKRLNRNLTPLNRLSKVVRITTNSGCLIDTYIHEYISTSQFSVILLVLSYILCGCNIIATIYLNLFLTKLFIFNKKFIILTNFIFFKLKLKFSYLRSHTKWTDVASVIRWKSSSCAERERERRGGRVCNEIRNAQFQ